MIGNARIPVAVCAGLVAASASTSFAAPLRIRSATALSGGTSLTPEDRLVLRGALKDDLGAAVPEQRVEISLDATPASVEACSVRDDVGSEGRSLYARTNEDGSFCVSLYGILPRGVAHLRFPGSDFHLPSVGDVALQPAAGAVALHFGARDLVVDLDKPSWLVSISVQGSGDGAPPSVRLTLLHQVAEQAAQPLATFDAATGDRVEVDVDTRALGTPGMGRLTARHAGSPNVPGSEAVATLRKTARVALSAAAPAQPVQPHDPFTLAVQARWSMGLVGSGWVEVRRGDKLLGAAPVVDGAARIPVQIGATRANSVPVDLNYLPLDDGWLPGPSIQIAIPVAPPSPWTRLPWIIAALLVAYWVVRTWRRPVRSEKQKTSVRPRPPGHADIVVHVGSGTEKGWRGQVVDAHTGESIEGARLELSTPAFSGSGILDSTVTASDGSFSFESAQGELPEGSELRVAAPWHSALSRPLPPEGQLTVSLVSRRRSVLDRIVAWATRRGPPWVGSSEPTPGEVAAIARRHGEDAAAAWARIVEEAAFGPQAPDETVETNVLAQEPRATLAPRHER